MVKTQATTYFSWAAQLAALSELRAELDRRTIARVERERREAEAAAELQRREAEAERERKRLEAEAERERQFAEREAELEAAQLRSEEVRARTEALAAEARDAARNAVGNVVLSYLRARFGESPSWEPLVDGMRTAAALEAAFQRLLTATSQEEARAILSS